MNIHFIQKYKMNIIKLFRNNNLHISLYIHESLLVNNNIKKNKFTLLSLLINNKKKVIII